MEFPHTHWSRSSSTKLAEGNIRHQPHHGSWAAFEMLFFTGRELSGLQRFVCLVSRSPWGPAEVWVSRLYSIRCQILLWMSAQTWAQSKRCHCMTSSTLWWNSVLSGWTVWSLVNSWKHSEAQLVISHMLNHYSSCFCLFGFCTALIGMRSRGVFFIALCEMLLLLIKTSGSWNCLFGCLFFVPGGEKSFLCSICRLLKGWKVCIKHGSGIK